MTITLGAQLMEELLVDNLDTVVVRLVSDRYICHYRHCKVKQQYYNVQDQ